MLTKLTRVVQRKPLIIEQPFAFVVLSLVLVLVPSHAFGWVYSEHHNITFKAYKNACQKLLANFDLSDRQRTTLHNLCRNTNIANCYAHMVATAADVAANPSYFTGSISSKYIKKESKTEEIRGIDCTDVTAFLHSDSQDPIDAYSTDRLFTANVARLIGLLDLVSVNTKHFMPQATTAWREKFIAGLAIDSSVERYQQIFATFAFGMHYLEDSMSAGHNGADRIRLRQDYDNAYHDDINHTGLFLRNSDETWHSYGDKLWKQGSFAIVTDDVSYEQMLSVNKELSNLTNNQFDKKGKRTIENLLSKLNSSSSTHRVISFAHDGANFKTLLSPCYHFDSCNKTELLIYRKKEQLPSRCSPIKGSTNSIYRCTATTDVVVQLASLASEILLMHLIGVSKKEKDAKMQLVESKFVSQYFTFKFRPKRETGLNKDFTLLEYSDVAICYEKEKCENTNVRDLRFSNWGFTIEQRTFKQAFAILNNTSLNLNLKRPFSVYKGLSAGVELELVNDDGQIFDGGEWFASLPSRRYLRNFLGFYVRTAVGINEVGRNKKRNMYASAGLGIDAHFAKYVLFAELESTRHYVFNTEESPMSANISIGVRGTAIDLRQ